MISPGQTCRCDVLIVGGGLAACMAALEASKRGVDVVLVDKGRLGRSGSSPTSGGVPQAAFAHADPRDSKEAHFRDTIIGGDYIPHQKIVRAVVSEITDRIIELEEIGLRFKKTADGKFYQEKRLGSSFARSVPPIGGSVRVMGMLRKEVFNREVAVHQWTMITRLFTDRGRVTGALGVNVQTGETRLYEARAVILAAGSAVALQKYTSANFQTTGDAYVAAFDAGAELANLEFLEFTLIPAPKGITIPMAGLSPFTSKGGRFLNAAGERFLEKYDPERLEGTTRAILVQAAYKEMLAGHGPVSIDPSFIPDEKWDEEIQYEYAPKLSAAGIDCRRDRFEWVPALHTFLGGIFVNERCESRVPGLFAAGESATGMHGSNRLSGNAIASCMVLGARSGKSAALFAAGSEPGRVDPSEVADELSRIESFRGDGGLDPYGVEREIKNLAWESAGVVRNEKGLRAGIAGFEEIWHEKMRRVKATDQRGWVKALECRNLARVGEMVTRSALERRESRGQHYREDYPSREKGLPKWVKISGDGERIRCTVVPIPFEEGDLVPKE
ncbi:MAG TPA: FAD-dependent oxidoreductase [candidate division Zixibacteria bacterium]|nr:FAD-dependent oxidoreductase [candidate division Zixibacteria bacterium]